MKESIMERVERQALEYRAFLDHVTQRHQAAQEALQNERRTPIPPPAPTIPGKQGVFMPAWHCADQTGTRIWTFTATRHDGKPIAEFVHVEPATYPAAKKKAAMFFQDRSQGKYSVTAEGAA